MATPYVGAIPAVKAFAVVIIGGLDSISGAIIAGLILDIGKRSALSPASPCGCISR
jgi:branched-chain amino acid transport system permease protein